MDFLDPALRRFRRLLKSSRKCHWDEMVKAALMWGFPRMGVPQKLDALFHGKSENNMDDLGVPLF